MPLSFVQRYLPLPGAQIVGQAIGLPNGLERGLGTRFPMGIDDVTTYDRIGWPFGGGIRRATARVGLDIIRTARFSLSANCALTSGSRSIASAIA